MELDHKPPSVRAANNLFRVLSTRNDGIPAGVNSVEELKGQNTKHNDIEEMW